MNNSLIYIHVVQISNLDVIVRGPRGLYNDLDMSEESATIYRLRLALTLSKGRSHPFEDLRNFLEIAKEWGEHYTD